MTDPLGVLAACPPAAITEVGDINGGALGVPELEIQERSACEARPSGRTVNGCRNLGTNA
jgi:hypothetical protein